MENLEPKKVELDPEKLPTWDWKLVGYARYKGAFQWGDEPEMIHIIQTGFRDRYLVVWEDAYEMMLGKTDILTREEIKNKFKIEFKELK